MFCASPPFKAKSSAVSGDSETASEKGCEDQKATPKRRFVRLACGFAQRREKGRSRGTCLQAGVTVTRVSDFGFVNLNDSCCQ